MSVEKKIQSPVSTLAELRQFLAQCEALGLPDDAELHAKTKVAWGQYGPRLREITAAHREGS